MAHVLPSPLSPLHGPVSRAAGALGLALLGACPAMAAEEGAAQPPAGLPVRCEDTQVSLVWTPDVSGPGVSPGHDHAVGHGLGVALRALGHDADYDVLMGDLGLAFIAQASDQVARYGGALDVGWWPLEPSCLAAYAQFAGQAAGRQITAVFPAGAGSVPTEAERWQACERLVSGALEAGRPVLGCHDWWKVITGVDRQRRQLAVFCPARGQLVREELPGASFFAYLVLGEAVPALERGEADRLALQHAVALSHNAVPMPQGYVTGQKAFALWAQTLRDAEHRGEARWHANMLGHLRTDRRSAVAYLRAMAARHPGACASRLEAAAGRYEEVLALLDSADLSRAALEQSVEGREKLAVLVERVAAVEARAVGEMEAALRR
ncbi:MAG: hypothetical protein AB1505_31385 [Candidatus Latescibacterota bacterium]